jgi:hypothetical protein
VVLVLWFVRIFNIALENYQNDTSRRRVLLFPHRTTGTGSGECRGLLLGTVAQLSVRIEHQIRGWRATGGGRKRAIVWDGRENANPTDRTAGHEMGRHMEGTRPVAVTETVGRGAAAVFFSPEMGSGFCRAARAKGDDSLPFWQQAHQEYFEKTRFFEPDHVAKEFHHWLQ